MNKIGIGIGVVAGVVSIILWIVLHFFSTYVVEVGEMLSIRQTLLTLLLPAILAVGAALTNRRIFLFIAFLWSLPISFYLAWTPGIFSFFSVTCVAYLLSFLFLSKSNNQKRAWKNRKI